jgi:hypothetical protein
LFELLLWLAMIVALRRAVRARHGVGVICGVLLGYLLVADTLAAWSVPRAHNQLFDFFGYMFLGPLSARERSASVLPLPALGLGYPLTLRAVRIALSSFASWRCLRESAVLNPLLPRAYALDGIAMAFAGAAVVDAIEGVLLLWALALVMSGT